MKKCKSCMHDKGDHFVWGHVKKKELVNCKGGGYKDTPLGIYGIVPVSICKCCKFKR